MRCFLPAFLLMALAACSTGPDYASNPAVSALVEPYADLSDFQGVVALATDGELVSVDAFGLADRDRNIPHDVSSQFLVGSISKQFTAGVILRLQDEGRLRTYDPLSRFLPDFPRSDSISLHQLLTHRSGVPDIYALPEYPVFRTQMDTGIDEVVEALAAFSTTTAPGAAYTYSNGGYAVLARVIEVASGMSFGDAVHKYIADPLGLDRTQHMETDMPGLAVGYDPVGFDGLAPAAPLPPGLMAGSGSIASTAADLAKWMDAIQRGPFLTDESRALMLANHGDGYGYGLSVYRLGESDVWEHDGRMAGWSSDIAYYEGPNTTVIILSNVQATIRDRIRDNVANLLLEQPLVTFEPRPSAIPNPEPVAWEALAGSYSFGPSFRVHARRLENGLGLRANKGEESEFYPTSEGSFFSRALYANVRFSPAADTMYYGSGGSVFPGVRVSE